MSKKERHNRAFIGSPTVLLFPPMFDMSDKLRPCSSFPVRIEPGPFSVGVGAPVPQALTIKTVMSVKRMRINGSSFLQKREAGNPASLLYTVFSN